MRAPLLIAAALAMTVLAGCTGSSGNAAVDGTRSEAAASSLEGEAEPRTAGGEPIPLPVAPRGRGGEPHGEVRRQESAVEAEQQADGTWKAWYTVTLDNGVGDFAAAAVRFDTSAGSIDAAGVEAGAYHILATVESRGLTEQMARDDLDRHTVMHEDRVDGGRLVVGTWLQTEPLLKVPAVPPVTEGFDIGANTATLTLVAALPDHLAYDLSLDASSGSLRASGLRGGDMDFDVSSGSIEATNLAACDLMADASSGSITISDTVACSISADASSGSVTIAGSRAATLEVDTSSGSIEVEGTFDDVAMDASSGAIAAVLTPARSGSYSFDTSSGSIDVQLGRGAGQAYDAEGSASVGTVRIELSDGETVEESDEGDYRHVRSRGFDGARIQTTVEADASSGSVTIIG